MNSSDKAALLRRYGYNVRSSDLKSLLEWAQLCTTYLQRGATGQMTRIAKEALETARASLTLTGVSLAVAVFMGGYTIYQNQRRRTGSSSTQTPPAQGRRENRRGRDGRGR